MTAQRQYLIKPALLDDTLGLSPKEMHQVMAKIAILSQDPLPDGNVKKQIKHWSGKYYRIRSGNYRVIYTFDSKFVYVITLRRRNGSTYKNGVGTDTDDDLDDDVLSELDMSFSDVVPAKAVWPDWDRITAKDEGTPFPEPITSELLMRLRISQVYHARLLLLKSREQLWDCPGLDDTTLQRLDDYMFEAPLEQIMQQPDLILNDVMDLQRYKEGELLAFLLKLSPEQERYVRWPLNANGPTLVKGGPGTGKSTVALYRIHSLLQQLQGAPRILFTTYTNALVRVSEQLLQQLLGEDAHYVQVQTADKLVYEILRSSGPVKEVIKDNLLSRLTNQAIAEVPLEGNLPQRQAQKETLARMGSDYLLEEICGVIVARQIMSQDEYLVALRTGRKMRLSAMQRRLVWRVYDRWRELLRVSGQETWEQRRARAASLVEQSHLYQAYDAVVIDEAQDLNPSVLRMLVKLCKTPNRLFVTADANQSIYSGGFSWAEVHESLRFQGRTGILRANYRSTREIGRAARSYLTYGVLEPEVVEDIYINGGVKPFVRSVQNGHEEAYLLASFFKQIRQSLHLGLAACAVLCPGRNVGYALAAALREYGLEATFMEGQHLDLKQPGIKVLTLHSSKGLEFPIVALAGFVASSYPVISPDASDDERSEEMSRARRIIYVGMTRAMRALLVVVPMQQETPLLQGFEPSYWH